MRILITSDNHLGYNETDIIRGKDSFRTFNEIMKLGLENDVDLVIQGGDLFHHNKPSRNTYNKTCKILKKTNMSAGNIQNLDHPTLELADKSRIPFLSIHGNHDDPSGFNSVSPLDILHSAGLITYFGKSKETDKIVVEPLLVHGEVKLALYGLGYVKDRRLYKLLEKDKVEFKKVEGDYYHIMIAHQNRTYRAGEYWPEEKMPTWMDLVIFGHEHLSIKTRTANFDLIQVGSSVRTSLSADEAGEKYAYFLDIDINGAKVRRKELKTARPLIFDTVKQEELVEKIKSVISNEYDMMPLVRMRVLSESSTILPPIDKRELDNLIEDKIANPNDYIRILKPKKKIIEEGREGTEVKKTEFSEIFKKHLDDISLGILNSECLVTAMSAFVDKGRKEAFIEEIEKNNNMILEKINVKDMGTESVDDIIARHKTTKIEE